MRIAKILAVTLLCIVLDMHLAKGDEIDSLLVEFDKNPTVMLSNRLMQCFAEKQIAESAITFDNNVPADTLRKTISFWASEWYFATQRYDKGAEYSLVALPLLQASGDKENERECLSVLAICYMRQSKYDDAIKYAELCNHLDRESGDPDRISASFNIIGSIYVAAKQSQQGLVYLQEALVYAEKTGDPVRIARTCGTLSETEFSLGHFDNAIQYVDRAIKLDRQHNGEIYLSIHLAQKATILVEMGHSKEAVAIFDSIIPFFRKCGNLQSLAISLNQNGTALMALGKKRQAVDNFREAAELCNKMSNPLNELQARKGLYEALWDINPDSAKIELEKYNDIKNKLYYSGATESLARYTAEYGNEQLSDENQKVKHNNILLGVGILVAVLLLGVIVFFYMRVRKRSRLQQLRLNQISLDFSELKNNYDQLYGKYANAIRPEKKDADELSDSDKQFLSKTMTIINDQIDASCVNVDELSSKLAMSTSQFRRRLAAVADTTPQAYITSIRMQKARNLLDTDSSLSILDIAIRCGYDDQSSFTRAFKKFFGKSPTEYKGK
ncbi:MAG: helix-turn-helix domain-containing protein [Bacteroidales bacterium]|nr:helix-turn-helix domain-containing protein [Bacteroidales bacterium]